MKRISLSLFTFLFLLTGVFAAKLKVLEDANIRTAPSGESEIIKIAPKDTVLNGNLSEKNSNWFIVFLEDGKKGFIHKSLIKEMADSANQAEIMKIISSITNLSSNQLIVIGIIALIIWLSAVILSKTTKCVILYKWYDLILLIIPGIVLLLYLFEINIVVENIKLMTAFCIFLFCISVILSISGNLKTKSRFCILYILVSILTKMLLVILGPIEVIAVIGALYVTQMGKGFLKRDSRFRDGTQGNRYTILVNIIFGIVFGIFGLLIIPLIKSEDSIIDNSNYAGELQ